MKKIIFLASFLLFLTSFCFATEQGQGKGDIFGTQNTAIDANGNVGIGITSPQRMLHVQGNNAIWRLDRDTNSAALQIHRFPTGNFTTPWKGFLIGVNASGANDGQFFISDYGTNTSGVNTPRLTIDTDGNIGISTATPSYKLDVAGDINALYGVIAATAVFSNDIIISSRPAAQQSWILGLSSTTQITANVFTVACGTSTLNDISAWFTLEADVHGTLNRLTYKGATTHKFSVSLNACLSDTAVSATTSQVQVYKNGTGTGLFARQYYSVQDKIEGSNLNQQISLATNNYLEVFFTTDDGDDLSICQMQLNVIPVD